MLKLPFFTELEKSERILIAGAGGGYDVFCGLPLYFALKSAGKTVHLANLSFSFLPPIGERLSPAMLTVSADTPAPIEYFPELYLSQWFREALSWDVPIYSFERTGVQPMLENYRTLIETLSLDTIVLVDGGTDSLMRGDEDGLGTPHEDVVSIAAVHSVKVERKLIACLGFGVDHYHGVSNFLTLEAVAALTQGQGFLGMFSLLDEMPEVQRYRAASEYVFERMPGHVSIVSTSILSALSGHYGNHHANARTRGSTLWINPLMTAYWCFQLGHLADRILYLDEMAETETYADVRDVVAWVRHNLRQKMRGQIPD